MLTLVFSVILSKTKECKTQCLLTWHGQEGPCEKLIKLTGMKLAIYFQSFGPSFWTRALSLSSCKHNTHKLACLCSLSYGALAYSVNMQITETSHVNHLLLCPFHLDLPTISLLCHIRISVLMHGLLSILTERQTAVMSTDTADSESSLWPALVVCRE